MTQPAIPAHELKAGDVFERHGHTWTIVHVIRTIDGSVHVMCDEGDVWIPRGREVVVTRSVS